MKLHDDDYFEEERSGGTNMTFVYMALIMSTVILGVTALVFWLNQSGSRSDGSGYAAAVAQREARAMEQNNAPAADSTVDSVTSKNKLTSNELDIWQLPDTGRETNTTKSNRNNGTVTNQTTGETVVDGSASADKSNTTTVTADELASGKTSVYDMTNKDEKKDDKKDSDSNKNNSDTKDKDEDEDEEDEDDEEETRTRIVHADGTKEWVDINSDLEKNKYNLDNFKYDKPIMTYEVDGKTASWFGVDISANQGEVDFSKLKKAGCEFVMIKVGARGYSSGNIVMDENFETNLKDAKKAGLNIGVYFCSQAVTKSEAREEAEVLLDAIESYTVKYPVVFVMENINDDMARIEALDMQERTEIAKVFLEEIEDADYTPMLYGDKEWLMTMINLEKLEKYDIWLAQDGDKPDYPYQFGMWQYDSDGSIKGVSGDVAMSISFVDYAK